MSKERDDLERKKKDQERKNKMNNLKKAGGIILTVAGLIWGLSKGKKSQ